jgi:hypothetical protein
MDSPALPNITELLVAWNQKDQDALAQLAPSAVRELRHLAGERRGHVLQTTAPVPDGTLRALEKLDPLSTAA